MKKMYCKLLLSIIFTVSSCSIVTAKATEQGSEHNVENTTKIQADHRSLQYQGRIDFSDTKSPIISWPGTYIKTSFTGTTLALILDDQFGKNYFNIFIDQDWENPIIIACEKGLKRYLISDKLGNNTHQLTIFKRTEGEEGQTIFKGLELSAHGKILDTPALFSRRIEFIGDSITSGMGNEAAENGPDDKLAEKNNYMAYGAITARALNAEYRSISQSGIGLMVSWFNYTMPDFFTQLSAVSANSSVWDFSQWQPNVVVVNLFQNDSWLVDQRLIPVPSDKQRIAAYKTFIANVRFHYPEAYIIAALGSMNASKAGSKWPGYIEQAIRELKKETADEALTTLIFDFTGFEKHPRVKQHQRNAEKLTALIKDKLSW